MSEEFSGLDFAIGSVRGFRRWRLTHEGVLEPVSYSRSKWVPGENVAVCESYASERRVGPQGEMSKEEYREVKDRWMATHGMADCDHGFYAYFERSDGQYGGNDPAVSGVIDGYGEVLIGSKGFRASKAKILALAVQPFNGMWRLDQFFIDRLKANYPGIPVFESELAMLAEFPCVAWEKESVDV